MEFGLLPFAFSLDLLPQSFFATQRLAKCPTQWTWYWSRCCSSSDLPLLLLAHQVSGHLIDIPWNVQTPWKSLTWLMEIRGRNYGEDENSHVDHNTGCQCGRFYLREEKRGNKVVDDRGSRSSQGS